MIALSLIPGRRAEQGLWPTRKICGSPFPLDGRAVVPFWDGSQFLMTCVGNGKTGESFFVAAAHAVDFMMIHASDLPRKMAGGAVWEWMSPAMGHDIVLIKVTGLASWPHPSLPICHEASPIDYTANPPRGWRGCLISQGEPETQNGTPGTGSFVFWNDENGDAGPYGVQPGYANPVMKRWGELRILSVDPFTFRAGPSRDDLHPGLSYDNSSAPFIVWNEKAGRWEVLGLTYGGFMSTYRLPNGDEYWENGTGKGRMVTAQPEGTRVILMSYNVSRYGSATTVPADGAVSSMAFNHLGPYAAAVEAAMVANGGTVVPNAPPPVSSVPFVTSTNLGSLRNDYGGYVGAMIQTGSSPLTLTELGRMAVAGNSRTHLLKVFKASGSANMDIKQDAVTYTGTVGVEVASATVSMAGSTPGKFQYAALAGAVTLEANTAYFLMSQESGGGDLWHEWNTVLSTTGAAFVRSPCWGVPGGPFYTWNEPAHSYGPLDFKYRTP